MTDRGGSERRPEPKWMTPTDLMLIVAGIALGASIHRVGIDRVGIVERVGNVFFAYHSLAYWASKPLLVACLATALPVIARMFRHRRGARAGEWVALAGTMVLLSNGILERAYGVAVAVYVPPGGMDVQAPSRWPWALRLALPTVIGALGFASCRDRLPIAARSLWLAALGLLVIAGPLHVLEKRLPGLVPDRLPLIPTWPEWLWHYVRIELGKLPALVLLAVPTVAGLRSGGRDRWSWTDGVGLVAGVLLLASWPVDRLTLDANWAVPTRLADLAVRGMLLVAALAMAGVVGRILADTWRFWVEASPEAGPFPTERGLVRNPNAAAGS